MLDNWLEDIKIEIGTTPPYLFTLFSLIATRQDKSGIFANAMKPKLLECIRTTKLYLGEIRKFASNYTLHDIKHSINVIDLMGQLVCNDKLSIVEISILIYSALLHDIGMIVLDNEEITLDELREEHGNRSAQFISEGILINSEGERLSFGEYRKFFIYYLPMICASHMQDFMIVEQFPVDVKIDGMKVDISLCAILLRLADAMDLGRNRAPYSLYSFLNLKGVSDEHWKKHLSITSCKIDENGYYRVDGICEDERVHRCLFNHLDMVESELNKVFRWYTDNSIVSRLVVKNNVIVRNIDPKGYYLWNHSIQMDFPAISKLFMGELLYGRKQVAIREIIQNSIDACLVRHELNNKKKINRDYSYEPKVDIYFDFESSYVYIRDNGIGMTEDILRKYFLNIGTSYYRSPEYKKLKLSHDPMGYFGIGFMSCFMLSKNIMVRTSHWEQSIEYQIHLCEEDRFVSMYVNKISSFSGTEIRLDLTSLCDAFYANEGDIISKVEAYLKSVFWRLDIKYQNNLLACKIANNTFLEYAQNELSDKINKKNDYVIDISKYLNGVEGLIHLKDDNNVKKLWQLNGINYNSWLDAILSREVAMGDPFPFCKNNYFYDGEKFSQILDMNVLTEYLKASNHTKVELSNDDLFYQMEGTMWYGEPYWMLIIDSKYLDTSFDGLKKCINVFKKVELKRYLTYEKDFISGFSIYDISDSHLKELLEDRFCHPYDKG